MARIHGLWAAGVVACATLAGCERPVVFQPVSDPKVQAADLPREDVVVRTFAGHTTSQSKEFRGQEAPAVAVVTSGRQADRGRCRFVFFVEGMAVAIDLPIHGPLGAGRARLQGKAWDPRGWDVEWTATLEGGVIEGTFKQPHDHGEFRLREVK